MEFKEHIFPGDAMRYIAPSWTDLQHLTFLISKQIHAIGMRFDRIITLARGGWPMTRCLVDFLSIEEVASIGVKFYSGLNERFDKPQIYQDLPVSVENERVLLFDDVADTGSSLQFTLKHLLEQKRVKEVTTATLITKPHSRIKPDFFGAETPAWVIFPYDVSAMLTVLKSRWMKQEVEKGEMRDRFHELGFKADWIEYYMD
jgi:hypoxanthine phosphoribosyltransferase